MANIFIEINMVLNQINSLTRNPRETLILFNYRKYKLKNRLKNVFLKYVDKNKVSFDLVNDFIFFYKVIDSSKVNISSRQSKPGDLMEHREARSITFIYRDVNIHIITHNWDKSVSISSDIKYEPKRNGIILDFIKSTTLQYIENGGIVNENQ